MLSVPRKVIRRVSTIEDWSRQRRVEIPAELVEEFLSALTDYLPEKGIAITRGVFPPGASEPYIAETGTYQHAWRAYMAAWRMFGLGATKEQVGKIAWQKLVNFSPFAREALDLPKKAEDVAKWLWHQTHEGG